MIGIVGPQDSVALATRVSEELGRANELVCLAYVDPGDAIALARQLEPTCDVLLFTGQVPFEQAKREGHWQCEIDVILHSPADLYRMIAIVLKTTEGDFPRVSVDTIDGDTVRRAFSDIGLAEPLVIPAAGSGEMSSGELARRTASSHAEMVEAGQADAALTCLAETYRLLREQGVKAWRIEHAPVTVRQALERAWYSAQVRHATGRAPAVVLVAVEDQETAAALQGRVVSHARRLGSRATLEGGKYTMATTRAAVDAALARHRGGQRSLIDLAAIPPVGSVRVGVGFGDTFDTAAIWANTALQLAAHTKEAMIVREDASVETASGSVSLMPSLQETSAGVLRLAAETGLGPLVLRRLVATLNRLDSDAVTAQQLANFYGVTPRSARRMIRGLVSAEYAREAGVRGAAGAGRPHVVYSVDLARISRVMSSGADASLGEPSGQ